MLSPLREVAGDVGKKLPILFAPAPAWRIQRDTNTDTPLPPDEPAGENPPDGAIIDYDLAHDAHGPVTIEVLDAAGKLIRRYSSKDAAEPSPEELRTNLIPPYWPKIQLALPATAGMHRWVWDLRATPPTATHYEYPIAAVPQRTPLEPQGPLVVPGTYTVKLTVDGQSVSQPLVVRMDPRVHISLADLETLHATQAAMAASLDSAAKADLAAHAVMEQLAAPENSALGAQLIPFNTALKTLIDGTGPDAAKRPPGIDKVTSDLTELYGELQQADALPTAAQLAACAHLETEAKEVLPGWEEFEQRQIPALDQKLRGAHLPPIDLNRQPTDMPESGDED